MNKETFTLHFDQWYKTLEELEAGIKTAPTAAKDVAKAIISLLIMGINFPTISRIVGEIVNTGANTKIINMLTNEIQNMAKYNSKVLVMISTLSPYAKTQALCMKLYECAENLLEELIKMEQKEKNKAKLTVDDRTGSETIDIPEMTSKEKEGLTNQALDQYNKGLINQEQLKNRLSQLAKSNENVIRTVTGFGNLAF